MINKLTELIKEAMQYADNRKDIGELYKPYEEYIAEYLIDNNTIVTPCKVGDRVYFNHAELNETCPARVIKMTNNYYTPSMPIWITIEYQSELIGRQEVEMGSEVFKLVCHCTKEEAEKALKGGGK